MSEYRAEVERHLADPYNRLRYLYAYIGNHDDEISEKCYPRIYHFLSTISDSEAHY